MIPLDAVTFGYPDGRQCDAATHTGKAVRHHSNCRSDFPGIRLRKGPLEAFRASQLPRGELKEDTQCVIDETGAIRSRFMVKRERRGRRLPVNRAASSLRNLLRSGCTSNHSEQVHRYHLGLQVKSTKRKRNLGSSIPVIPLRELTPLQDRQLDSRSTGITRSVLCSTPEATGGWLNWRLPSSGNDQFDQQRFTTQSQIRVRDIEHDFIQHDFGFDPPSFESLSRPPTSNDF